MSTTYRARIIRADDSGLWVSVPALGDAEFGPLESIVSDIIIKPKYTVGDRVIIEQIGSIPEDFIVVGIAARTIGAPPDWSLRNIDASQVVSGVLATARIPDLDASKITSGRIPLMRLASHGGEPDTTQRLWITTNPGGGWGGADHTMLVMSPPTDAPYANALFLRVGNTDRFAISKDGVISVGTVPANNVDKMTSGTNHTNLMGTVGSVTEGWAFQVNDGSGVAGLIHNNAWRVQWNSSGTMLAGSVPAERITGGRIGAGNLSHIAANPSANPPYAIFGVNPAITYDTPTTAIQLGDLGGTTAGTRARIYDAARKVIFQLNRDGGGDYAAAQAFYDRTTTAAANVQVGTSGALSRSTSLRAAKVDIEDAPKSWGEAFWNLRPRTWIDKASADHLAALLDQAATVDQDGETKPSEEVDWENEVLSPLCRIPGFVAEEVADAGLDVFVTRDDNGEMNGLAYERMLAAAVVAMKEERQKRIDLEARIGTLVSRIEALEGGVEA